jgi:hypothetical protein
MNNLYAIIVGSVVVNVIVADANFITLYHPEAVRIDLLNPVPGIRWIYNGSTFTPPS